MSLVSCIANSMDTSSASKHNVWPVQILYRDVPWPLIASVPSESLSWPFAEIKTFPHPPSLALSFFFPYF